MRVALALCLTGCSVIATTDPNTRPRTPPDCTTSHAYPLSDVAFSVVVPLVALRAASNFMVEGGGTPLVTTVMVGLGLATVGLTSAVIGTRRAERCKAPPEIIPDVLDPEYFQKVFLVDTTIARCR